MFETYETLKEDLEQRSKKRSKISKLQKFTKKKFGQIKKFGKRKLTKEKPDEGFLSA